MMSPGRAAPPRLSAVCGGRDNNLNLMRFLAATLVIFTHAFGLTLRTASEPFHRMFDMGGGDIGVNVFFVLSGFLVTKSWAGRTLPEFAWARCMRIYPGLWVSVLVTVVLVGLFFATVPAVHFWLSRDTLTYLARNFTMLPRSGAQLGLPHALPIHAATFNVSLWTLPLEIEMYLLLALLGTLAGVRARYVAILALLGCGIVLVSKLTESSHDMLLARGRFLYFFFAGSLAYVLRERIVLSGRVAAALLGVIVATVAVSGSFLVRQAVLALAMPYLLLWFAYVPAGAIRNWNRLGDYSYGLYIYAVPIQIAVLALGIGTTPATNFTVALLVALAFAVASWHLLERRALRIPMPHTLSRLAIRVPLFGRSS
jgi:peptidoglycan/LPS O-acetylase OafA/YrhL